jgi:hypothetical protein
MYFKRSFNDGIRTLSKYLLSLTIHVVKFVVVSAFEHHCAGCYNSQFTGVKIMLLEQTCYTWSFNNDYYPSQQNCEFLIVQIS